MNAINQFYGEYRFLSNFFPCLLIYDGIEYPTVEHAYQAQKTLDIQERYRIAILTAPGKAKRRGRVVKLRDDWGQIKLDVMARLLRIKFASRSQMAFRLLSTGQLELIEGNDWGDTYWGVCRGKGENHLGKLLMKIREELRATLP